MTPQEIINHILQMNTSEVTSFNSQSGLNYEVWQDNTGGGLPSGAYANLVVDAANWTDTTMNSVNALSNIAGVKPKKRCEGCS